jgi:hypothetical protein
VHVRRARKGGVPGKPTFEPSEDQKFMVAAMAGMRMSIDEMRLGIRNSYTGAALSKPTFMKAFKHEISEGPARLKGLASSRFYRCLDDAQPWAIRAALRNRFGWTFEGSIAPPMMDESFASTPEMRITFVSPTRREPIDITPPAPDPAASPYEGRPADPALPQIEPPRPRERTDFGIVEQPREPRSYESRMPRAEEPPSIWHRPSKDDWMK